MIHTRRTRRTLQALYLTNPIVTLKRYKTNPTPTIRPIHTPADRITTT